MTFSTNQKVHASIHCASAATGVIGAGLAQLPMADMVPINALQLALIAEIGLIHGIKVQKDGLHKLLTQFLVGHTGRAIARQLVGFIPGYGNTIKAATAVAMTEAVGWAANAYFRKLACAC